MGHKSTGKKKGAKFHFTEVERAHMFSLSDEFYLAKRGSTQDMTDLWDKITHEIIAISPERGRAPQSAKGELQSEPGNGSGNEEDDGQDGPQVDIDCESAEQASKTSTVFSVLRKVIKLCATRQCI